MTAYKSPGQTACKCLRGVYGEAGLVGVQGGMGREQQDAASLGEGRAPTPPPAKLSVCWAPPRSPAGAWGDGSQGAAPARGPQIIARLLGTGTLQPTPIGRPCPGRFCCDGGRILLPGAN
ncbi:AP-5 complex subunit zeta-1 [Platysternon megacephalum]|uniref:AP-5 complex subunit zeta-1 n=1 Tax=Platysternon megacephalum TaxID=55544 RepID=A0A4D9DRA5_9SAUR|nr:AP-5 complex subunit zeta-1 [Platysternon megacephalum]